MTPIDPGRLGQIAREMGLAFNQHISTIWLYDTYVLAVLGPGGTAYIDQVELQSLAGVELHRRLSVAVLEAITGKRGEEGVRELARLHGKLDEVEDGQAINANWGSF